jgi:S-methylmethionine-dependent homocysteine/selenocysteine methylase
MSILHRLHSNGVVLGAYANRLIPIPPPSHTMADSEVNSGSTATGLSTNGMPHPLRTDLLPEQYYCDFVQDWVQNYNVRIIGGCCGITPKHIDYLHHKFKCE